MSTSTLQGRDWLASQSVAEVYKINKKKKPFVKYYFHIICHVLLLWIHTHTLADTDGRSDMLRNKFTGVEQQHLLLIPVTSLNQLSTILVL